MKTDSSWRWLTGEVSSRHLLCFKRLSPRVDVEKVRSHWSQKGILRIKIPESTTTTQTARDSWTYWPIFCSFLASSPSRRTNIIFCFLALFNSSYIGIGLKWLKRFFTFFFLHSNAKNELKIKFLLWLVSFVCFAEMGLYFVLRWSSWILDWIECRVDTFYDKVINQSHNEFLTKK